MFGEYIHLWFALLGVILFIMNLIALAANWDRYRQFGVPSRVALSLSLLVGVALAVGSLFLRYDYSPTIRISGFPFFAVVWELSANGRFWMDFISPLTPIAYLLNAVFFLTLPQTFLAVWSCRYGNVEPTATVGRDES